MQQDAQQNISAATPTPTFPRDRSFPKCKAGTGESGFITIAEALQCLKGIRVKPRWRWRASAIKLRKQKICNLAFPSYA